MQQQQQEPREGIRETLNTGFNFSYIHIAPLVALFRKPGTIGVRYFGIETFWAFCYLPLFGAIVSGNSGKGLPALMIFWLIYIALLAIHRGTSALKRQQGNDGHSRYIGDSWLTRWTTGQDEMKAKKQTEPLACLLLGVACLPFSTPLGLYLVIGAFLLPMPLWVIERREEVKKMDWQDAQIDNHRFSQWMSEQNERNEK